MKLSPAGWPACLLLTLSMSAQSAPLDWSYPPSVRGEVVDDYHGTKVADPYRWLE